MNFSLYYIKFKIYNIMKNCSKCNKDKNEIEFHSFVKSKDGLNAICKSCKQEYDTLYRKTDKVQKLYKSKIYRDSKIEYQKSRRKDPRILLLSSAKSRAKKGGLAFNLTIEDIIVPEFCPILNVKLERKPYGKGGSFLPASPSLDKINPLLGYIKGNVMVISMKANAMKYNATKEELITFSKNILKLFNNDAKCNINNTIME